jgi:CRISPR-associated protein Csb2
VGFLALPWVGHPHADGRLMGAAFGIPDGLDESSKQALFRAVGTWEAMGQPDSPLRLTFGRHGVLEMERLLGPSQLVTLRPGIWRGSARRPSRRWVSATPVALPANPGRLTGGTASARAVAWRRAEQAVVDSCLHVGLPEPAHVVVSLAPFITGSIPALRFPAFHQRGRDGGQVARRLVHTSITFERAVRGPLVLGAGRYLGLGLMRPVSEKEREQTKDATDD